MTATRFNYLYRDDANYKQYGQFYCSGTINSSDTAMIWSKLDMGEMFVAEQVGFPSLRDRAYKEDHSYLLSDNGWHWLTSIEIVECDCEPPIRASSIVKTFSDIKNWNLSLAEIVT